MIWVGDTLPPFVRFAYEQYKKINRSFDVKLIYYSTLQFENLFFKKQIITDIDLICYNLLNDILNQNRYTELIIQQVIQLSKSGDIPFIQLFCDILRLELLNKFGGIYVDCDTFPIKSFDDNLLNKKRFLVYDKLNNNVLYRNNYFIGLTNDKIWNNYFDNTADKIIQINNQQIINMNKKKSVDYLLRRVKFFKCKLTENDMLSLYDTNDYFEHYSEFRWGTGKVNTTKFDMIFNKKQILQQYL